MVHLLHRLYGVDAPAFCYGNRHNAEMPMSVVPCWRSCWRSWAASRRQTTKNNCRSGAWYTQSIGSPGWRQNFARTTALHA